MKNNIQETTAPAKNYNEWTIRAKTKKKKKKQNKNSKEYKYPNETKICFVHVQLECVLSAAKNSNNTNNYNKKIHKFIITFFLTCTNKHPCTDIHMNKLLSDTIIHTRKPFFFVVPIMNPTTMCWYNIHITTKLTCQRYIHMYVYIDSTSCSIIKMKIKCFIWIKQ